jgi:hypothetical protein
MQGIDEKLAKLAEDGEVYKGLAACFGLAQSKYFFSSRVSAVMDYDDKNELRVHVIKVALLTWSLLEPRSIRRQCRIQHS